MSNLPLSGDQIAALIYLGLLLTALVGYGVVSTRSRADLGRRLRHGLLWGCIFVGVIAGVSLWEDVRRSVIPRQAVFDSGQIVEVPRAPDGHFYIRLALNGVDIPFVVDTGATEMVLGPRDARRVGLSPDGLAYTTQARTANGMVATARTTLDRVELAGVADRNVPVLVNSADLDTALLGMSYLDRWSSLTIAGDRLVLRR